MKKRELPDRVCSTEAKKQAMIAWTNEMLDRWRPEDERCSLEKAVERADKEGNIEPLRQALLKQTGYDLDRFLRKKPAGRKRGQHYPIVKKKDPVTEAAIDAKIIWWLWKRKYPKRPTGVNAKQIAADRHKVSVDEVINKSKKISFEIIPSAWATLGPRKHLNATQLKIECFTVSTDGRKIQSWWDADF